MTSQILVAYESKYGTTAGFAQTIGEILESKGFTASVARASEVETVEPYDVVILGSPIYFSRVLSEAGHFVQRLCNELSSRKVAMFAVGVTQNERAGREFTEQALSILADNCPGVNRHFGMFRGRVQLSRMNLFYRTFLRVFQGFSDVDESRRNDLEEWVDNVISEFQLKANAVNEPR